MKRIIAVVSACATALLLTGCGPGRSADSAPSTFTDAALPSLSAQVLGQRGTLVTSTPIHSPSAALAADGIRGWTVTYRSASGVDGSAQEVSGVVFVPPGRAPTGGWPVLSYGHGVTGLDPQCGPSLHSDLLGYDLVVASLLQLGFVVTMTDYQGWGSGGGSNAYLEPKTAAFNMIDAVRAARARVPEASDTWYAVGVSEGGQAAWAANEYASAYGDGLRFQGAAASAPTVDLTGLASLARSGWLSHEQQLWLPLVLAGMSGYHPELNADDYLHGALAQGESLWSACTGPQPDQLEQVLTSLTSHDTEPVSNAAAERLRLALTSIASPQRRTSGPMLVITGEADQTVNASWVRQAVQAGCRIGDSIQLEVLPGEGHSTVNSGPRIGAWLLDRLAGKPVTGTC